MSTIGDIESVLALLNGIDSGKMDQVWDGFAQKIQASAAKDIGEAKEVLGEDFRDYVPVSRQAMRAKRDKARLKHEKKMNSIAEQKAQFELDNLRAAAAKK